jgi:hypothetical protein|tara:strand:- start:163 stop:282 length:120 start_codon:yes stop_codon:yes gene_type:complete
MIDKILYKFFSGLDVISNWIGDKLFGPRCKCGKNKKNGK